MALLYCLITISDGTSLSAESGARTIGRKCLCLETDFLHFGFRLRGAGRVKLSLVGAYLALRAFMLDAKAVQSAHHPYSA